MRTATTMTTIRTCTPACRRGYAIPTSTRTNRSRTRMRINPIFTIATTRKLEAAAPGEHGAARSRCEADAALVAAALVGEQEVGADAGGHGADAADDQARHHG